MRLAQIIRGSNGVVIKPTLEHPPVIVLSAGWSERPTRSLIPYGACGCDSIYERNKSSGLPVMTPVRVQVHS